MWKYSRIGYSFSAYELYETFHISEISGIDRLAKSKKYGFDRSTRFLGNILTYFFYLVILDIVKNNTTFLLTTLCGIHAEIKMKVFTGESYIHRLSKGTFSEWDPLFSGFKGYQIFLSWNTWEGYLREKPIYIDYQLKDQLIENVKQGKLYY